MREALAHAWCYVVHGWIRGRWRVYYTLRNKQRRHFCTLCGLHRVRL